jgi:predicted ester cyclase
MDNKQIVRRVYDAIAPQHLDTLAKLIPAALLEPIALLVKAFPDIKYTLEEPVAEGDRVAVRFSWTGTHAAQFRHIPASGKTVTNTGLAIYTLRDGVVTAATLETDRLGFLQQLGATAS